MCMQNNRAAPMDASKQFCPNQTCSARGQIGEGNIRIHSYHPQRYRCGTCQKTFSARRGTMMEGLRTPTDLVVTVVILLSYGCPLQAIVQAYGLDERTVAHWQSEPESIANRCMRRSLSKETWRPIMYKQMKFGLKEAR